MVLANERWYLMVWPEINYNSSGHVAKRHHKINDDVWAAVESILE